jgi:hypothetical protein
MKKTCLLAASFLAAFANAQSIRPVSNPVWTDNADVGTSIHPVFMRHRLPDQVSAVPGKLPLGGDVNIFAVQLEIKLAENLSLIAVKDGYIDFNPDATLKADEGFADLAAGLKTVFHRGETLVLSGRLVAELPTGDDEVWQGNGDGLLVPALVGTYTQDKWQVTGTAGYMAALDDAESSMCYQAWHLSYRASEVFVPLVEINHFHVADAGDGGKRFDKQADGAVPAIVRFEGNDLINLGAANADDNPDYVSLAVGARLLLSESLDLGAAYEFMLTDEEESLTKDRVTLDAIIRF